MRANISKNANNKSAQNNKNAHLKSTNGNNDGGDGIKNTVGDEESSLNRATTKNHIIQKKVSSLSEIFT